MPQKSRVAVYTGSFDPITLGHVNVIERASKLFDKLIVGIGINVEKRPLFTPDERVELIRTVVAHVPNVDVQTSMVCRCVRTSVRIASHGSRRKATHRHRW